MKNKFSISALAKPFFVLAPMDDVTDTVFRQIVAKTAAPDLYFTEFVNVDGLQSPGRPKLISKLAFTASERPLIVQLWGKNPENYYKCAREIADGTLAREANEYMSKAQRIIRTNKIDADEVQGSEENRRSRNNGTATENRTKLTQQFAANVSGSTSLAGDLSDMINFAGVDINMGCPAKPIIQNGCCSALILNRGLTGEILQAVREGVDSIQPGFPVSVKTRLGFKDVDLTWHEFLLQHKLNMLTIHGRTTAQMSKVPADWSLIGQIAKRRTSLAPDTLIVGNGDVLNRAHGIELAEKYNLDGIMIGRGIFHDPYVFADKSPWGNMTKQQKIELYTSHVKLFQKTWPNGERNIHMLNKFCKVYIEGFPGAKDLREKLMHQNNYKDLLSSLKQAYE